MHAAVLCLSLLAASTWPDDQRLPASPQEAELIADAADGSLDEHRLLDASLVAAGAGDDELPHCRSQYELLCAQLTSGAGDKAAATRESQAIPRRLLKEMHRLMLTGQYDAACSDLRRTLANGDYNCVSATILYLELCRRHRVAAEAIAVPAHVFCRLAGAAPVDVQTTCSVWLGKARDSGAQNGPRRVLSEVQLVAKVYYNRGVLQLQQSEFMEAVRLLRLSLLLDPDDRLARNNLLAAVNNWCLAEADRGRYRDASRLLEIGRGLDGRYAPLLANDLHVHQRWVRSLCEDQQFGQALRVLEAGHRRRPDAELYRDGRFVVLRLWAESLWSHERFEEGFQLFDSLNRPQDQSQAVEAEIQAVTAAAAQLAADSRRPAARKLVDRAQRRHRNDPRLRRLTAALSQR